MNTYVGLDIGAQVKAAVEQEARKRADIVRSTAETLWKASRLRKFTLDEYVVHRDNCSAMKHYFPLSGSIPKYTWAILPLPAHEDRSSDGCPACDVAAWADCLKRANAAAAAALLPGSD